MKNPPAFQFYPADFLTDENVMLMTLEEKGAYVVLLCACWIEGTLPDAVQDIAILCGVNTEKMQEMWVKLRKCFKKSRTKKDRLIHPRLSKERKKQIKYRKGQAGHGAKSKYKATLKATQKGSRPSSSPSSSTITSTDMVPEPEASASDGSGSGYGKGHSKLVGLIKERARWIHQDSHLLAAVICEHADFNFGWVMASIVQARKGDNPGAYLFKCLVKPDYEPTDEAKKAAQEELLELNRSGTMHPRVEELLRRTAGKVKG